MAAKKQAAKKKAAESGTVRVHRYWSVSGQMIEGSEESYEDLIEVPIFDEAETSRVSSTLGMTLNMGNYESVKISISTSLPCYTHPEEMEAAYQAALKFTKDKLTEQIQIVKSRSGGKKG